MNSSQAVRYVSLQFIENYKDHLDEDNFDSMKLLIEGCKDEKVVKLVTKVLKPFSELSRDNKLTKEKLVADKWIKEDSKITTEEIQDMGKQAEMAYTLCSSIDAMPPDSLKQIESMAQGIQGQIEEQLSSMTEEQKENADPMELITKCLSSSAGEFEDIAPMISTLVQGILPSGESQPATKSDLMQRFANIDGNIDKPTKTMSKR
tara:strand:+ start:2588 stop:3202 length:615 start_codon:yes stop_codon:yes gene_type:complete